MEFCSWQQLGTLTIGRGGDWIKIDGEFLAASWAQLTYLIMGAKRRGGLADWRVAYQAV